MKRAVAFGDSLTAGFQSPTRDVPYYDETPYTRFLSEMMHGKCEFITKGVNGELTSGMLNRFNDDVVSLSPDYVMILGGTNDIGWGVPTYEIYDNLVLMYIGARKNNVIPIAITVPSLRGGDAYIPPRVELNDKIIAFAKTNDIPYIDLFSRSAESGTLRLKQVYSNDSIHMSTAGYNLIASMLYEEVLRRLISSD